MKKVLLFGPMPPPIGGVSIHIQRFLYFSKEYLSTLSIDVCDLKKRAIISRDSRKDGLLSIFLAFLKTDIVHIHISNNLKVGIALISKLFRKKVVYTHHNSRVDSQKWFQLINFLSDKVILVNDKEINLAKLNSKKIEHIPAFLPPYDFKKLPKYIEEKIESSSYVLATNCFRYTLLEGKDLYGFDLLIEAYAKLMKENQLKKSLLILVDPSGTTKDYVEMLLLKYPMLTDENLLYVGEAIDFSTLIKQSDLTIRATRSDGDSLSIRESLYLKVPVIASDVTYRPEATILFKNENVMDLKEKIHQVYKNRDDIFMDVSENFAHKIISVYQSI